MDEALLAFLARKRETTLSLRGHAITLRLLSAQEILNLERSCEGQCDLWCDAALLRASLFSDNAPLFPTVESVLEALSPHEISALAAQYDSFDRQENPSLTEGYALKKA